MSKTKKPRNKKMSQSKKDMLQTTSFGNNAFDLKVSGTNNLKLNNTNRTATKMIRGAARGN